jgi:hypothetical protein
LPVNELDKLVESIERICCTGVRVPLSPLRLFVFFFHFHDSPQNAFGVEIISLDKSLYQGLNLNLTNVISYIFIIKEI